MPQAIIYMDEKENDNVEKFAKRWQLSKAEAIKKILKEYKER
jgi:hypothetical protein